MGKTRGFTLIELMVAVAVMAIVTMIAAPSFKNFQDRQQVDFSSKDFEKTLIQARYDALLHRKTITVHLNQTGTVSPTDLYWAVDENETMVFKRLACTSEKWVGTVVAGVDQLAFSQDGNAQLSRGDKDQNGADTRERVELLGIEITLSNNNIKNYIEITPFGKVTVSKESKQDKECS
ncbi:pilus assembly FimT family protein [Acinetobacter gyllenbergii]|uniref:pilus assembly FimT family protein n=1 Tax=Acinetobacter gyllenbergii TaxID=134534 RepID=UPI000806E29D|nr:prepilin-type N-terminal cleavage/methylation domain-containing protein [Acinetobacter gyllenbergii]OBY74280.1 type IV fimbrial biogenesis protein FimT [Acinetobacter gyllenbergii]